MMQSDSDHDALLAGSTTGLAEALADLEAVVPASELSVWFDAWERAQVLFGPEGGEP